MASIFIAGVQALDRGGGFTGPVDVSVLDGRIAGVGSRLRQARDQARPPRPPGPPRLDAVQAVAPGPFGIMIFSGTERPGYLAQLSLPLSPRGRIAHFSD